jgi:hypothetical protein
MLDEAALVGILFIQHSLLKNYTSSGAMRFVFQLPFFCSVFVFGRVISSAFLAKILFAVYKQNYYSGPRSLIQNKLAILVNNLFGTVRQNGSNYSIAGAYYISMYFRATVIAHIGPLFIGHR